jgi:NAD(P)H-flavin reductase
MAMKVPARIGSVQRVGEGVYDVSMKPEGRVPKYKAGQFLHLAVDDFDPAGGFWPESRVFSMASKHGDDGIRIVYSVKGAYTQRMERELAAGGKVWLKLPYGDFIIGNLVEPSRPAVLVAGGTGISPFIPHIRGILEDGAPGTVILYYGVRKPEHFLFPMLLSSLSRTRGHRVELFCENPDSGSPQARTGSLRIDTIREETAALAAPVYFLSGPPAMIRSFRTGLVERGVPAADIKIDEWE